MPLYQFSLRGLMRATMLACVTLAVWRIVGWLAIYLPLAVMMVFIARAVRDQSERRGGAKWALMLGAAVLAHMAAASIAYETFGEVYSALLYFCLILYFPCVVAYSCGWRPHAAAVGIFLALLFVPTQIALFWRHIVVRSEVARIAAFADGVKLKKGVYPRDLGAYDWNSPGCREYIKYELIEGGDLRIDFWSGNSNASHWYSSTSGWGYYPD